MKTKQIKIIPRISLTEDWQKIYIIDDWKTLKVKKIKDSDFYEINKTVWWLHLNEELLNIVEWYNKRTKRIYEVSNLKGRVAIKNHYMVWTKRTETYSVIHLKWIEQYRLYLLNVLWRLVYSHPCMKYVWQERYTQYDLLSDLFLVADWIMTTLELDTRTKIWKIFYLTHFHNACWKIKKDYKIDENLEYWTNILNILNNMAWE